MFQTLLITDCDRECCDLYQAALTGSGFRVESAMNGLDCMQKVERFRPALLVLDRDLAWWETGSGMLSGIGNRNESTAGNSVWNGCEGVLACLRDEVKSFHVPVLLTATPRYRREADGGFAAPIVELLFKPFTPNSLMDAICGALANKAGALATHRRRMSVPSERFQA